MPSQALPSLQQLENAEEFLARHIGIDAADEARMLPVIGSATRAELIDGIVPAAIRRARPMRLPAPVTEADALAELKVLASKNKVFATSSGRATTARTRPA
jgi:glycine dehydrogenase